MTKIETMDKLHAKIISSNLAEKITEQEMMAFCDAKKALEKQIPKQIVTKVQAEDLKVGHVTFKAGTKTYYCPDCNKAITLSDTCCRWCGQKLKLD